MKSNPLGQTQKGLKSLRTLPISSIATPVFMENTVLSALVLCADPSTLRALRAPLEARRVSRHVATNPAVALNNLAGRKFDLLIVDLDGLDKDWLTGFYKVNGCCYDITVIAMSKDAEALGNLDRKRARFTLQKPLAPGLTGRAIDAACNAILVERQPAFRCVINLPVLAVLLDKGKERKLPKTVLKNISYTGASIESSFTLPIGETISLRFNFPESGLPFQAVGKVIWSDSLGHCGIQFQQVPTEQFSVLREWLDNKAAETNLPAVHPAVPVSDFILRRYLDHS